MTAGVLTSEQEEFLASLLDGLSLDRMEVDHIDLAGPAFEHFSRDLGLPLIRAGLARAVVYSPEIDSLDPMSTLYGSPLVIDPR